MMKKLCNHPEPLCRCIDWKDEDFDVEIDHLIHNFEFLRFALEYEALEPGKEVQMCELGRCRICGGRICYGTSLMAAGPTHDLMDGLYRRTLQRWRLKKRPLPDGAGSFEELFVSMFHEEDWEAVRSWLPQARSEGRLQECPDVGNEV